jgi:hypothetical protein
MDTTDFKKIFSKSDYQLPIRWDGKDFYKTLYLHLKKYREDIEDFYPDLYSDVKTVCRGICAAVGYSFRGYPAEAYESFKGVMKILGKDPLLVEKEDINKEPLYRVVDVENAAVPKRQRVFHVPFSMRSKMSTQRYSIPGFPCLYLGTSVELCCMEINKDPKRDNVCVSWYELQTDECLFITEQTPVFDNNVFKIFDISIKPEKAIETMCNNDLDIAKYIKWYPLISACSYIRAMSDDDYSAEYIIPQLFIQWARSEDEEAVVGIKYFSCSSIQASTLGNNYVFATTGTPYHARNPKADYCVRLSHRFKLTEPRFIKDYDSIDACVEKIKNDKLDYIEDYNASEDKGIETNYSISEGVFAIGSYAFSDCYKVEKIDIPESVMSIGNHAFLDCSSLTDINIPDSVMSIGDYAFSKCSSLTSITIPDSVTSIGESTFKGCTSLTNITVDESNEYYTSVNGVLYNKDKSKLLCYPAKKPETEFKIPNSTTSIGERAFSDCCKLEKITIPDSVMSISESAFEGCTSLTNIIVDKSNEYYTSVDGVLYNKDKSKLLCYPAGKKETSFEIPNGVTSIGHNAFEKCRRLKSIILNGVTSIGDFAFEDCSSLTSITIPDSVTSIGYSAFVACDSLDTVYYSGTREQKEKINIDGGNECLLKFDWKYKSPGEEN